MSSFYKETVEEVMVVCGKECSEVPEPLPHRNNGETENTVLCIKGTTTILWKRFYNMVHNSRLNSLPVYNECFLKINFAKRHAIGLFPVRIEE